MREIKVKNLIGSEWGDTYEQGQELFDQITVELYWGNYKEPITLDFSGVKTIQCSFFNGAFYPLVDILKFDELKSLIKITKSTRQINHMIKNTFETLYSKKEILST